MGNRPREGLAPCRGYRPPKAGSQRAAQPRGRNAPPAFARLPLPRPVEIPPHAQCRGNEPPPRTNRPGVAAVKDSGPRSAVVPPGKSGSFGRRRAGALGAGALGRPRGAGGAPAHPSHPDSLTPAPAPPCLRLLRLPRPGPLRQPQSQPNLPPCLAAPGPRKARGGGSGPRAFPGRLPAERGAAAFPSGLLRSARPCGNTRSLTGPCRIPRETLAPQTSLGGSGAGISPLGAATSKAVRRSAASPGPMLTASGARSGWRRPRQRERLQAEIGPPGRPCHCPGAAGWVSSPRQGTSWNDAVNARLSPAEPGAVGALRRRGAGELAAAARQVSNSFEMCD